MFEGKKTYIGIIIFMIPLIAKAFGYEMSVEFEKDAPVLLDDGIHLFGAIVAFYGRAKAETEGFLVK